MVPLSQETPQPILTSQQKALPVTRTQKLLWGHWEHVGPLSGEGRTQEGSLVLGSLLQGQVPALVHLPSGSLECPMPRGQHAGPAVSGGALQ